ncbi:hypothetical protein ROHU_001014 [Labeo rohita]|uniref:Ig-like domain-containing protein n=1 Tax=Labeo rohita TaxID=84645 RepID=A0A498P2V9_LABRO|nr:hypothetical protein ROHU_001014 [Labeo rohita]
MFAENITPQIEWFMFNWFWKLLLLPFCVIYTETTSIHVPGKKGGNATLPCGFEARDILDVFLKSLSKNIPVCKTDECSGRIIKKGACDIIIKDLRLSDAGKYILRVHYRNDQEELKQQTREYHLHIDVEIFVKTGEELKLDVLFSNADKVLTNSSGEWREVWNRTDGVLDHHMTDTDGNLTIKVFTANDTGTYRVLDSKGEILITVTVTESSTLSKEMQINTDDDKTDIQGSSDLLRVQIGESISLNCSMRNRYEIAWYHFRSEQQLDLLISAEKDESGRRLLTNYNPNSTRLKLTADTWVTRATLVISGVTGSDSGLYFCGTKSDAPEMFFDKPNRLEIEEEPKEVDNTGLYETEKPTECDNTDEVSVKIGEELKLDVLSNADKGLWLLIAFAVIRAISSHFDALDEIPICRDSAYYASVQGSSDLLRVQKGESISLNCSMRNRYEINWYLLRYEKLDLLISAEKDKTGRRLLINYNPYVTRVKMTADTWVTRATVDISGVTESDSGLYFCGTKSDAPEMFFDKPIRLEIKGLTVVQETKEEADNTDGVKLTERVFMYGGVGLAVLVFFVATFITGRIIHYCVTSTKLVIEQRGGYVILPCDFEDREIAEIEFSRSENSTVCWNKECERDRIFKKENCDIVIKNLSFSDAGKYILRFSYVNNQSELEQQNRTYQLHIHDEVSVKIGEELKLDVLLPNADKVEHQGRRSTGWKEDWSRTDGVQSERLTIRDGNLIISHFTARDAGTYIVLDSEGNIMIMVTVRVSSTVSRTELELKGKLNYTGYDKPNYTTKPQEITTVVEQKGGYVTLPCEQEDSEIIEFGFSRSENSTVCQNKKCESDRIFKKENCGIVIKNLSFSDAGKYILRFSYINNQTMLEQIRTYQLCVDDEISVKIGEELKLDVLLPNADKVQHQGRRSTGWKEDWSRSDGVQSERLTIRDGNLTISHFTARDAGTYEVLDPEGNILIMVKVSVSSTVSSTELESEGKLNYTGCDKPNDTKQQRTSAIPVTGEKGGKVTLPCEYETNTIFHTDLINRISVKTGEELKMDVLLPNADKVETNSGGEWRKVWKRGHRVWRDQMIDNDGNQIIKEFKANDAGTYRVLDSEGNILITVTVTVSTIQSLDNTDKGETDDTQQLQKLILAVGVCLGILVALAVIVIVITVTILQHQQRDYIQVQGQENTELPEVLGLNISTSPSYYLTVNVKFLIKYQQEIAVMSWTTPKLMERKKGDSVTLQYEISVKIGEELKLDVLLPNADKVQHQSRRSTGWKEDWSRSKGVQSERRTIRDENLTISHFTARDAGTYEVLDPNGKILIMVTVRVSSTAFTESDSKGQLNTNDDKPYDGEKYNEVSVKSGEELLLSEADKAQHQSRITKRKEDWSRNDIQSKRMTDNGGNQIINEYMDSDAETYNVLDSEGETLIGMTLRGSKLYKS